MKIAANLIPQFDLAYVIKVRRIYPIFQSLVDLVLAGLYILTLIYVYFVRIHIIFRIQQTVAGVMPAVTKDDGMFSLGNRALFTAFLNLISFMSMILLLGLQIYYENLPESKSSEVLQMENSTNVEQIVMSYVTVYMLITTLLVPILSIVVFALANYYYLLELMIKINFYLSRSAKLRNRLRASSDTADDIINFAKDNIHATPGRLRDLYSLNAFQRVFYILREWWADLLSLCWISVLGFFCYFSYTSIDSDSDSETLFPQIYLSTFIISASILALTNFHVILIVIVAITLFLPLCVSVGVQTAISKSNKTKVTQVSQRSGSSSSVRERSKNENEFPTTKVERSNQEKVTDSLAVKENDGSHHHHSKMAVRAVEEHLPGAAVYG